MHTAAPLDLAIDIINPEGLLDTEAAARLRIEAHQVLAPLGVPGEIRARLVDDAHMIRAHERYTNTPGTTDVLTFDLRQTTDPHDPHTHTDPHTDTHADSPDGPLDVDLLVCVDEARRQSAIRNHAVERELLLYIVHGVLHCLGYDDHTPADAKRIHAREDALLAAAGIGPIFAVEPVEPAGSAKSDAEPPAFTANTTTTSTPDPISTPHADGGAM